MLDGIYRWTADEYVLRCEQGADIREVLSEGRLDRDLYRDALSRWSIDDVTVLDADAISATGSAADRSVKAKLLDVAARLRDSEDCGDLRGTVAVVVDRDWDRYFPEGTCGSPGSFSGLLRTDGYSIENYAVSADCLDRFVRVLLGRHSEGTSDEIDLGRGKLTTTGEALMERIAGAGIAIASVRAALRAELPPKRLVASWIDYVSIDPAGTARVDTDGLLRSSLNSPVVPADLERAVSAAKDWSILAATDFDRRVRGHDLIQLLLKLFRCAWGRRLTSGRFRTTSETEFSRVLLSLVDSVALDDSGLFTALRGRFT